MSWKNFEKSYPVILLISKRREKFLWFLQCTQVAQYKNVDEWQMSVVI